ncbi:MAG TPA: hypothetical protein DCG19_08070 [Cryomorphaceae bacterium]|nr:hypothetical protein [Owenweeksia sp.]HAD97348.1 hypothetical protein [Cryomorphaceae bacterium]HCQ17413.1 hypothetical protein [Cryomorphaceae bacterium]|tara:strand:+ start:2612 stop:4192 length:1581 start_codon:yes stop_codon:yes gene_type:complete
MPFPRVFVSSTYVDLVDARDTVTNCLENLKAKPIVFERSGISYDHSKPMDLSCYESVKECDMVVLIIGGRYGSSSSNPNSSTNGLTINSITKTEYLEALAANIKVLTFIKESVLYEYSTFKNQTKAQQKNFKPTYVDNLAIFDLITEIHQLKKNNAIYRYHKASDIEDVIRKEFSLLAQQALKSSRNTQSEKKVLINAYKMFYYRRQGQISLTKLSSITRLKRNFISSLEKVKNIKKEDNPDKLPFRMCELSDLKNIERALNCENELEVGKEDDLLSHYINYYHCNRGKQPATKTKAHNEQIHFPKKAVVLDFDGTMTTRNNRTTWEMLWVNLGYSINECNLYHRQYSNKLISHEQWCRITKEKFQAQELSELTLNSVASEIDLVDGVKDLVEILNKNNIEIHILSGSVEQIITRVLGPVLTKKFTHIQANSFKFTNNQLSHIQGTPYDFEGKATYITNLLKDRGYSPQEVLFVGNSSNDKWASRSGAVTLCVNPHFTDGTDIKEWLYCIREMDSLMEILTYIPLS